MADKAITKYPTTPQTRRYITLWNVCVQNRNDPKLSETNFNARLCHLKQSLKNVHLMMLASFLFTDEKIFTVTTPNNTQSDRMYACRSNKKQNVATKRLRTEHSVTDDISRRVTSRPMVDITPGWYLSITEWRLVKSTNRNVMLIQEFLPTIGLH